MNRRYRLTVLSPVLAGSGELLTPIDYMVWQNEVRVLDQERIFKLLARNPRLESYLEQLRKADRAGVVAVGRVCAELQFGADPVRLRRLGFDLGKGKDGRPAHSPVRPWRRTAPIAGKCG